MKTSARDERCDNIMFKLIPYLMREIRRSYNEREKKATSKWKLYYESTMIFIWWIHIQIYIHARALRIVKFQNSKFSRWKCQSNKSELKTMQTLEFRLKFMLQTAIHLSFFCHFCAFFSHSCNFVGIFLVTVRKVTNVIIHFLFFSVFISFVIWNKIYVKIVPQTDFFSALTLYVDMYDVNDRKSESGNTQLARKWPPLES